MSPLSREQAQQLLLDTISDYAWMKDRDGRFMVINRALARTVNATPDQMIGRSGGEFWSQRLEDVFLENDRKVMETREPQQVVEEYFDDQGRPVWRHSVKVPVYDSHGVVIGTAGVSHDMTEFQRTINDLRASQARMAEAERMGQIGSWQLDIRTGQASRSDGMHRILGTEETKPEIDAQKFLDWVHPEDRAALSKARERCKDTGERLEMNLRLLRSDGAVRHCRVVGERMLDERGKPDRVIGVTLDVTERHEFEQELKRSRSELRRLSAGLLNLQEEERKKIAREIHDEFGQALTALKLELSWLVAQVRNESEELQTKAREMAGMIDGAIEAMRRTVTELRPGVLDDLGLADALKWQVEQFSRKTGIDAALTIDLQGMEIPQESSAPIFRIVQEALTNVIRHAEATKVRIRLFRAETGAILTINDNGRGITAEALGKATYGLIGMRERAQMIGALLWIDTAPGQGTTIRVELG